MTNARTSDEIRSVQLQLSRAYPTLEIRTERPQEAETYDVLVELAGDAKNEMRGTYMSTRKFGLVIQRWMSGRNKTLDWNDAVEQLLRKGLAPARHSSIPIYNYAAWDLSPIAANFPNPGVTVPLYVAKIKDISSRVLQAEKIGDYVGIVEIELSGWRVTSTFPTTPTITTSRPVRD